MEATKSNLLRGRPKSDTMYFVQYKVWGLLGTQRTVRQGPFLQPGRAEGCVLDVMSQSSHTVVRGSAEIIEEPV